MASHLKRLCGQAQAPGSLFLCALILSGFTSCASTPDERLHKPLPSRSPRPAVREAEPAGHVYFLVLNPEDHSGWIAYRAAGDGQDSQTGYRITVTREEDGELLYEGLVPLPENILEDGFETDPGDAGIQEILSAAERNLVAPLLRMRRAEEAEPAAPPAEDVPEPAVEAEPVPDAGFRILEIQEDRLVFTAPELPAPGTRFFLREQPQTMLNPATGTETLLSRGRVAGLVEVTEVDNGRATAVLRGGDMIEDGVLEAAGE